MNIERKAAFAPRTRALAEETAGLRGPCIGCADCQGLCAALIEALALPSVILRERDA